MQRSCTAFDGKTLIATGDLKVVAAHAKAVIDGGTLASVLIFDDITSEPVEVDFRGTPADVQQRLEPAESREVTLLPRHWDWLNAQPGGASVALRKLVEDARRTYAGRDRVRQAQESAYRFLSAMAGNEPGFEEGIRALFAGNRRRFEEMAALWPQDVAQHARRISAGAFSGGAE